jgi:NNP family nitrate/nitrite transporter-like MFS transporter
VTGRDARDAVVASTTATTDAMRGNAAELTLGTVAFVACFYAWSLFGPLGPDLQDHLRLSEFQLSAMVAVPVLLGSLLRVPLGS